MRVSSMLLSAFAAIALLATPAAAKTVTLAGNHSSAEIKAACGKAGGTFIEDSSINSYGCSSNCNGGPAAPNDSNGCHVSCFGNSSPGNCQGTTPGRTTKPDLQNLDAILTGGAKKQTN